jgi:hemolysin activation/secretion protein
MRLVNRTSSVLRSAKLFAALKGGVCAAFLISISVDVAQGAALPGPADAGRMDLREGLVAPQANELLPAQLMPSLPTASAPKDSAQFAISLREVVVTGMTIYKSGDVKDIYEPYLGREVALDTVWMIAGQLTERYHSAGYFLTRVVVPEQKVKDGTIILRAVEGYIGQVKLDDPLAQNTTVKQLIEKLLSYRPVKAEQIERVLLRLNDLPGVELRAVLEPMTTIEGAEGAVRLVLEPRESKPVFGSVSVDNYGSRFLGPYQAQAQAQITYWPGQKTTVALMSSLEAKKVTYASLKHELPLFVGGTLELYGAYTRAAPGYTLKPYEIRSWSPTVGAAFSYSFIRQRQENLTGRVALELHNAHTDILTVPLTRDNIRTARFNVNYQRADAWEGQNLVDGTLSQGLPLLGASRPHQWYLSNAGAKPDFTKFNLSVSRLQNLAEGWDVYAAASGQLSTGPLYSSEQFGFGGQAFGRAYDDSEITGDRGIAASAELRYSGIKPWYGLQPIPYQFYDTGAVWNGGPNATKAYAAASSVGAGFRMLSEYGVSGNLGFAFPLTRKVANPLYGNGKNPRVFFQVAFGF